MRPLMFVIAAVLAGCNAEPVKQSATEVAEEPPAQVATSPTETNLARMPQWDQARAAGVDFRAVGQEPGWLLDIYTRGTIKFVWDYGERYSEFAIVEPTHPQEGLTRYEANSDGVALVVNIRRAPCQDAMSGEAYPSSVEVVVDGRTLNGCGRSV